MRASRPPVIRVFVRTGTVLGLLLAPLTGEGRAAEPRALPVLELTGLDGRSVSRATLATPGAWLLLYTEVQSDASGAFLGRVAADPRLRSRGTIAVVVGGRPQQAAELAGRFRLLTGASWYADPSRSLSRGLGLAGAPVALGVRGEVVEWSLTGVLADVNQLKSILATWTER